MLSRLVGLAVHHLIETHITILQ